MFLLVIQSSHLTRLFCACVCVSHFPPKIRTIFTHFNEILIPIQPNHVYSMNRWIEKNLRPSSFCGDWRIPMCPGIRLDCAFYSRNLILSFLVNTFNISNLNSAKLRLTARCDKIRLIANTSPELRFRFSREQKDNRPEIISMTHGIARNNFGDECLKQLPAFVSKTCETLWWFRIWKLHILNEEKIWL